MKDRSLGALAFESLPEPLAVLEGDEILAANKAWNQQIGARESLRSCVDARDHEALDRARAQALTGQATVIARIAVGDRAGSALQWTLWPSGEGGGCCIRIDGPPPPETSAKAKALLQMFDSLDATLWIMLRNGVHTLSDGKGLAHYGLVPGQIVGWNGFEMFPPDSYGDRTMRAALRGERVRAELVEDNRHWVTFCEPVRGDDGAVEAMIGFGIVIGENVKNTRYALDMMEIINRLPLVVWAIKMDGTCTLSVGKGLARLGLSAGELVGKNLLELYTSNPETRDRLLRGLAGETFTVEMQQGEAVWRTSYIPARDGVGSVVGLYGISEEITERKREEMRSREQFALIQEQRQALANLASPIIEVWQGVLVVPIIGSLNEERATIVTGNLLESVAQRRARYAILDMTGVEAVDTSTAHHLSAITRSVELLGCTSLVSGIRPIVAATMVALDISLPIGRVHATLAEALRRCIQADQS